MNSNIKYKKPFITGIGGTGVSNIARFFLENGIKVYGSDIKQTPRTTDLENLGAEIFYSQSAENITKTKPDAVFYSQGVLGGDGRYEIEKAKDLNIPTFRNAAGYWELIGKNKKTIAITGAHGKTTVTGLTSVAFEAAQLDPTVISGANIKEFNNQSYKSGKGENFIVEACEYREQFLLIKEPYATVILNIEHDHPDYYKNIDEVCVAFTKFANNTSPDGFILASNDEPNTKRVIKEINHPNIFTFGKRNADFCLDNIEAFKEKPGYQASLHCNDGNSFIIKTSLFGEHNIWNAAVAFITVYLSNKEATIKNKEAILEAIYKFKSSERRQEYIGDYQGIPVYDDYAHHPTQIKATIEAVMQIYPKVGVIFEAHQYSRTRDLLKDFGPAFIDANQLAIFPIFEVKGRDTKEDLESVSNHDLFLEIQNSNPKAIFYEDYSRIPDVLESFKQKNVDLILNLGAGPLSSNIRKLFN